jgi:hypothetical protein
VHVAVGRVPEQPDACVGHDGLDRRTRAREELGQVLGRERDIEFVRRAEPVDRLRVPLAVAPQRRDSPRVGRHRGVADTGEHIDDRAQRVRGVDAPGCLDQHVRAVRTRERRREPELLADEVEPRLFPDLERAQPVDVTAEHADRTERVVHRGEGEQRDDDVLGPPDEP